MQKRTLLLLVITACVLFFIIRSLVFVPADAFSDDASYLLARQAETFAQGNAVSYDALSGTGREVVVPALVYFARPLLTFFTAKTALLTIVNVSIVGIALLTFFISYAISRNAAATMLAVSLVLLAPSTVRYGLLSINTTILTLFFLLGSIYLFLRSTKRLSPTKKSMLIVGSVLLYACGLIIDPVAVILPVGVLLYFMFNKADKRPIPRVHLQIWLTTFSISVWYLLIVYKDALIMHGVSAMHGNIPFDLRASSLVDVKLLLLLTDVGILPLILAALALYSVFNIRHDRPTVIVGCVLFVTLIFFLLTFIDLEKATVILSILVAIISVKGILFVNAQLASLKNTNISVVLVAVIFIITIATQLWSFSEAYEFISQTKPTYDEKTIDILTAATASQTNKLLFVPLNNAHEVQYRVNAPVAVDTNFLLQKNADEAVLLLDNVYTSRFATDAISALNELGAGNNRPAVVLSTKPLSSAKASCWTELYVKGPYVYETSCDVIEHG